MKIEITNFIYDYKKDELLVNIDYEINGDRKDVLIFDDKESLDEFLKTHELEVIDTRLDKIKEQIDDKKGEKNEEQTIEKLEIKKEEGKELVEKEEKTLEIKEESKIEKQVFFRNILAGIGRGIGIGIGVTIMTAVIILVLQKIVTLNIPVLGQYISDIVDIVERTNF